MGSKVGFIGIGAMCDNQVIAASRSAIVRSEAVVDHKYR